MNENSLLERLSGLFASGDPDVVTGTGPDDCAHVRVAKGGLAFSVDVFAEGSHFLPDASAADVAVKCLGASVSDLAASGCRARWALVGLCLKKGAPAEWAGEFARSLADTARRWGTTIVGGDTVSSPHSTFVSVTVVGEPLAGGPILRSGGEPGDVLVVTGNLGGSILGRHLRPAPRLREMAGLMEFCAGLGDDAYPHAAMDISDGLALDLSRLCRESGVGAVLHADAVPISADAYRLAEKDGRSPLAHALSDGEDFELLAALPQRTWESFVDACGARIWDTMFTRIGALTPAGEGLTIEDGQGVRVPLAAEGYEHSW